MSDANILGLCEEFEFEGRSYKVAPRSFAHEALYRTWLEREGLRALQRHRKEMGEDDYQVQMAGWRQDCATGIYAWPRPRCIEGMLSPEGLKQMAFIALAEHNGIGMELIDRIWDMKVEEPAINPMTKEVIKDDDGEPIITYARPKWEELQALMGKMNNPNRKRPAGKA